MFRSIAHWLNPASPPGYWPEIAFLVTVGLIMSRVIVSCNPY